MKSRQTQEQLIVFTRYPEPGTTKTRLVESLGERGAAELQRKLAEHTLSQVRHLLQIRQVEPIIYFAGGSIIQMQNWLGTDLHYREQGCGDLGQRLQLACAAAFKQGIKRLVIVGADCPGLRAYHMNQALDTLLQVDLVLGPATDGGYYLIGIKRENKTLFAGIQWGTETVLAATVKAGKELGLSIELLDTLSDVDRPEDLKHFHHYSDI
jgi:rSAM/selenodomain-associated transferase 1